MIGRILPWLVVLGCGAAAPPRPTVVVAPTAEPRTSGPRGVEVLDGGAQVRYQYDFDHDELARTVVVAGGVVAVTGSGNLLGFDDALAIERELVVSPPVDAIAVGPGDTLVAGLRDGTLVAVDPRTLAVTRIGAVAGQPVWIQRHGDRLIVVAIVGWRPVVYRLAADDLARGEPPIEVPRPNGPGTASTWLIDGAGRLWYGADQGEWGGWAGSIDLATGAAGPLITLSDGVYGLIAHGDAVWAYGGMSHMGYNHASITELRGGVGRSLWPIGDADSEESQLPIAGMTELGGRLRVIAWNRLYEVTPELARWTKIAEVPARFRWGRPDAVGAYPAITGVLAIGDDVVLATLRDGLFRVRGGAVEGHAIADPLDGGVWSVPVGRAGPAARWPGSEVSPVPQYGAATAARAVALGDELWDLEDGTIWRWHPTTATWQAAGAYPSAYGDPHALDLGFQLDAVAAGGRRLIHDVNEHALYELVVDGAAPARVRRVLAGRTVLAAILWDGGRLLLATDRGVVTFDPSSERTAPLAPPLPAGRVEHLARDRDGRLWLATATELFVIDGARLHAVTIPVLIGRGIVDLSAAADGGVAVALGEAGVVQLVFTP